MCTGNRTGLIAGCWKKAGRTRIESQIVDALKTRVAIDTRPRSLFFSFVCFFHVSRMSSRYATYPTKECRICRASQIAARMSTNWGSIEGLSSLDVGEDSRLVAEELRAVCYDFRGNDRNVLEVSITHPGDDLLQAIDVVVPLFHCGAFMHGAELKENGIICGS